LIYFNFLREKIGDDFEYVVDDYVLYVPIVEMYIADTASVKSRNN